MGRKSIITLDYIKDMVKKMAAAGQKINAGSVRVYIGGHGSPNHIQKFLDELKKDDDFKEVFGETEIPVLFDKKFKDIYFELKRMSDYIFSQRVEEFEQKINELEVRHEQNLNYQQQLEFQIDQLEKEIQKNLVDQELLNHFKSMVEIKNDDKNKNRRTESDKSVDGIDNKHVH